MSGLIEHHVRVGAAPKHTRNLQLLVEVVINSNYRAEFAIARRFVIRDYFKSFDCCAASLHHCFRHSDVRCRLQQRSAVCDKNQAKLMRKWHSKYDDIDDCDGHDNDDNDENDENNENNENYEILTFAPIVPIASELFFGSSGVIKMA